MSKRSRNTQRLKARPESPQSGATERDRRLRLGLMAVPVVLVVGLGIAAIAFLAAGATGGSGSLPSGTQVFAENDHAHVSGAVTYDRVPPAGGPHNAVPLNCGVYTQAVSNENAVHSLEHGAVWITYQSTLSADQVALLQQVATSNYVGAQRYVILSPHAGLASPIVASAWGAQLSLDRASDSRLVAFIRYFAGGGQGGERGGECSGGVGSPVE